jgi:hypothetical protein
MSQLATGVAHLTAAGDLAANAASFARHVRAANVRNRGHGARHALRSEEALEGPDRVRVTACHGGVS